MSKLMNGDNGYSKMKNENLSDEDMPLAKRVKTKSEPAVEEKLTNNRKRTSKASEKSQPEKKKIKQEIKTEIKTENKSPKKVKKEEEPVWEWWKEKKNDSSVKWKFLEHNGPLFAPPYEPLPDNVKFYYDGKPMKLRPEVEEIATFYAKMYDHEYTLKESFNKNFMNDWTKVMNKEECVVIKSLDKCNFKPMQEYFRQQIETRKAMSKEEKDKLKKENEIITEKYGFCMMDNYRQKIGNFRIEPPGLFRGRGNHPRMGSVKRRVLPRDVIINCSKGSQVPRAPGGTHWKEVKHDPKVTWLACWVENVQKNFKYVMLNASSRLKGEKDWVKYETARKLHAHIDKIREDYTRDLSDREMRVRQRAVALYFIDKLALRAGNEKGQDEADTVGCCSLRFEHITLHESVDGQHLVAFDFLGKDSIRYVRSVAVPKKIFGNVRRFMEGKAKGDDLFDRLNTALLNQYLRELMDGLTAKVFRTYNASLTLENELDQLNQSQTGNVTASQSAAAIEAKLLEYNRANRAVAILCNHQRAPPKTFDKSMENMDEKITKRRDEIKELKKQAQEMKTQYKEKKNASLKESYDKLRKKLEKQKEMLSKLEIQKTDRNENKEIALGTSKLNYLDPRISIAWCKRNKVPINKIYNKTQLQKFQWAIDMAQADFRFSDLSSDKSTNVLQRCDSDDEDSDNEEDD